MLKATHKGVLKIGDKELACYVLEDGQRVLSSRQTVGVLMETTRGNVVSILSSKRLKPLLSPRLNAVSNMDKTHLIEFDAGQAGKALGLNAELLIEICEVLSRARDEDILTKHQLGMAKKASIILRACAKIGIIALIDEATGYQAVRPANELETKVQMYLRETYKEWESTFPMELFKQFARLIGYEGDISSKRPQIFGKYINDLIYGLMDKDLPKLLKERNPYPKAGSNHHQLLSDPAGLRLKQQLWAVIGILKASDTIQEAYVACEKAFGKITAKKTFRKPIHQKNIFEGLAGH